MSKERLEEIGKNLDPLGYGMGGHLISVNDINWLVGYAKEQVERVQELEKLNKRYKWGLEEIEEHTIHQYSRYIARGSLKGWGSER